MTEPLATTSQPDSAVFRPVHYLGCKLRVLDTLESVLDTVDPARGGVLDIFSGTGVVAAHLARRRPVIAADIQEYARVLASALLAEEAPSSSEAVELLATATRHRDSTCGKDLTALIKRECECVARTDAGDPDALCSIIEDGSLLRSQIGPPSEDRLLARALARANAEVPRGAGTVLTRYYGGVYFSYEQALMLDGLTTAVRSLRQPFRDVGLAAVMSTASDIVSSVGNQFAQPLRPRGSDGQPKTGSLRTTTRRRQLSVPELFLAWMDRYASLPAPRHESVAVRGDFEDILASPPPGISVIYADPPYTRDHYSRYYHVLETIALGDEPEVSRMRLGSETLISRGLYRDQRHQSPFCIKSRAPQAFATLFAGARRLEIPIVVSYSPHGAGSASRPRLLTIQDIVELARERYSDVEVISAGRLAHSKLNASRLNSAVAYDAELLIACRP
jgi:adenine-specific DNA-methyltransferase